jgi:hypothetical protein
MKKTFLQNLSESLGATPETRRGSVPYEGEYNTNNMLDILYEDRREPDQLTMIDLLQNSIKEVVRTQGDAGAVSNFQESLTIRKNSFWPDAPPLSGNLTKRFIADTLSNGSGELEVLKTAIVHGFDMNVDVPEGDFASSTLTDMLVKTEHLDLARSKLGLRRGVTAQTWDTLEDGVYENIPTDLGTTPGYRPKRAEYVSTTPAYNDRKFFNQGGAKADNPSYASYSQERRQRIEDYNSKDYTPEEARSTPLPVLPGTLSLIVDNLSNLAEDNVIPVESLRTPSFLKTVYLANANLEMLTQGGIVKIQEEDKRFASPEHYVKKLGLDKAVVDGKGRNALHHLLDDSGLDQEYGFNRHQITSIISASRSGVPLDREDKDGVTPRSILHDIKAAEPNPRPNGQHWTDEALKGEEKSIKTRVEPNNEERRMKIKEAAVYSIQKASLNNIEKEVTILPMSKKNQSLIPRDSIKS